MALTFPIALAAPPGDYTDSGDITVSAQFEAETTTRQPVHDRYMVSRILRTCPAATMAWELVTFVDRKLCHFPRLPRGRRQYGYNISMDTTWILVGSVEGVRILERVGSEKRLVNVFTLDNPEGRLGGDPSHINRSDETGQKRPFAFHDDPRERLVSEFYRAVADELTERAYRREFHRLILIADPEMLEIIRPLLPSTLAELVCEEIKSDLSEKDLTEISERLGS